MNSRVRHVTFGYEAVPNNLMPALTNWLLEHHSWIVDAAHILRAPNVLNTLAIYAHFGSGVFGNGYTAIGRF